MGCGSVVFNGWADLFRKIYTCVYMGTLLFEAGLSQLRHLKPGTGYFEHVEIDFKPKCDDSSFPMNDTGIRLNLWYEYLCQATIRADKPIQYPPNLKLLLEQQGFVDVEDKVFNLPMNAWPIDLWMKYVAKWYHCGLVDYIEALSLGPFSRIFHWPVSDIQQFARDVTSDIDNRSFHIYNTL